VRRGKWIICAAMWGRWLLLHILAEPRRALDRGAERNGFGKCVPWEYLPAAFRTVVIIVQ